MAYRHRRRAGFGCRVVPSSAPSLSAAVEDVEDARFAAGAWCLSGVGPAVRFFTAGPVNDSPCYGWGYRVTLYGSIMSLSSWSRMWQCHRYSPMNGFCLVRLAERQAGGGRWAEGHEQASDLSGVDLNGVLPSVLERPARQDLPKEEFPGCRRRPRPGAHIGHAELYRAVRRLQVTVDVERLPLGQLEADQVQVDRVGVGGGVDDVPLLDGVTLTSSMSEVSNRRLFSSAMAGTPSMPMISTRVT